MIMKTIAATFLLLYSLSVFATQVAVVCDPVTGICQEMVIIGSDNDD